MSSKAHKYITIICEGCGTVHGRPDEFADVASARQAAVDSGWKIIPKIKANGRAASIDMTSPRAMHVAGVNGHDVCPHCVSTFTPELLAQSAAMSGKPSYWTERIRVMEAEIASLKSRERQAP